MDPRTTSDRAAFRKTRKVVLLVALSGLGIAGLALSIHSNGAAYQTSDKTIVVEKAPPSVVHTPVDTSKAENPTPNVVVDRPLPAAPATDTQRKPLTPEEALLNGPKEPLIPREIIVHAEYGERGRPGDEPLVPKVAEEKAEIDESRSFGRPTNEPLCPKTITIEETQPRIPRP